MAKKPKTRVSTKVVADEELLNLQLASLYTLLSDAAVMGLVDAQDFIFSDAFIDETLTRLTFDAAVSVHLIEPPKGDVPFGQCMERLVTAKFRDAFVKRLENARTELRRSMDEMKWGLEFRQPTPNTTIRSFCIKNHLHPTTTFIKLIAPQTDNSVCFSTQRRIIRLMQVPDITHHRQPNTSQRDFSESLRKQMAAHDPARFDSLSVDDLLWLAKTEEAR